MVKLHCLPTRNSHIAVEGTDITDSIRPAIPAEGGMNINALVRIPTNAVALLNRLFRTITHETFRRVTAPRI